MPPPPRWGKTPPQSIEDECEQRGKAAVILGCKALLTGRDDADPALILALGGPPARWVETGEPGGPAYWLRVWAARGLLWAWDDAASPSILDALSDDAWRLREMALRVVARYRIEDALPLVAGLRDDSHARVRKAAERALIRLTSAGT